MDVSSTKTLIELVTSFAAANMYDIIDATLDETVEGNSITEIPALGVYRNITTTQLDSNIEKVTQRIKEFNADLVEVLSCIYTDTRLALSDQWDRSDDGFEAQQELISNFAAKYGIQLEDTVEEKSSEAIRSLTANDTM